MKHCVVLGLIALLALAGMVAPLSMASRPTADWTTGRLRSDPPERHRAEKPDPLPSIVPRAKVQTIAFCGQEIALDATEVSCNRPEVTDLSPLCALDRLQWVDLRHSGVVNLHPLLCHQDTLWALDLGHTRVQSLAVVGRLERLERLYLRGTPIRDLYPVARCRELRTLDIRATPVRSLWPLARLTKLEALALRDNPVRDLRPLAGLQSLTLLYLNGTEVRDLAPLRRLRGLQVLGLTRTRVRDLTPLSRLHRLELLYLADTPVRSLRPLRANRGLRVLGLSGTRVHDLSPVRGMTALQTLGVDRDESLLRQARALKRNAPELEVLSGCVGEHNRCITGN